MTRPFVAGNWKMNHQRESSRVLVQALLDAGFDESADAAVFPPALWLPDLARLVAGSRLFIGAQNCHQERSGAYTGELSATMIVDAGASHVILGHSERRQLFHESDATVLAKTRAAIAAGLTPIICIGETLEERETDHTFDRLQAQLEDSLLPLGNEQIPNTILAYEPVWAIGTGRTALPAQAQEVHAFLRSLLVEHLGSESAARIRVLYGGSVKPSNAAELIRMEDIDGFLVGGASLVAESFLGIIANVASTHGS